MRLRKQAVASATDLGEEA